MPEQTITRENEIELLLEIANKGLKKTAVLTGLLCKTDCR